MRYVSLLRVKRVAGGRPWQTLAWHRERYRDDPEYREAFHSFNRFSLSASAPSLREEGKRKGK